MDQPDTDNISSGELESLNPQMPAVTEDHRRANRSRRLVRSPVKTMLSSVISIFFIGLVSGAAGGLLLGGTSVVVLQSLELLANNRTLMDQLENIRKVVISVYAVTFGVFSSTLSLAAGIYIGFSVHSLVIKRKGEAATGKALHVAGLACLTGVTTTGYLMGFSLKYFLSITLNSDYWLLIIFAILVFLMFMSLLMMLAIPFLFNACFASWLTMMFAFILALGVILDVRMRLILASAFIPVIGIVNLYSDFKLLSLKLHVVTVRLMLIISEIYRIARQQIVALQSPTSTNTHSAVVEAIFVGVLASLMWTVTVGMSLFVSWQRGGAGKISAAAAAAGLSVLGVINKALPVLGPGPTIGALMGVAGAAGVYLSAAMAAIDQYRPVAGWYKLVEWLGVTLGAAVGAFLSSCAHSGLSGMFMALSAATVPPGAFLIMFLHSTSLRSKKRLCLHLINVAVIIIAYIGLFIIENLKADVLKLIMSCFIIVYLIYEYYFDYAMNLCFV